jgi:hypothetical protein
LIAWLEASDHLNGRAVVAADGDGDQFGVAVANHADAKPFGAKE